MLIQVTQEHIAKGTFAGAYTCPIALACSEAIGRKCGVASGQVWDDSNNCNPENLIANLPEFAHEWYGQFDAGEDVQPFEFDLEID